MKFPIWIFLFLSFITAINMSFWSSSEWNRNYLEWSKTLFLTEIQSWTKDEQNDIKDIYSKYPYCGEANGEEKKKPVKQIDYKLKTLPPKPAEDKWTSRKFGYEQSSYFFDFLDTVLLNPITAKFEEIFNKAIEMEEDPSIEEPYPLSSLVSEDLKNMPEEEQFALIAAKNTKFDKNIYKFSVTGKRWSTIIKKWNWGNQSESVKSIIDKYDFNGDGRLNLREFMIMMINWNKDSFEIPQENLRCQYCMREIVETYLIPFFSQCEACNRGFIEADDIWNNFRFLKRKTDNYDIYKCRVKNYRATAVNDFVLKSCSKKNIGKITKQDFIKGILYGYWNRQTTYFQVVKADELTMKSRRWGNGQNDLICKQIEYNIYG